MSNTSCNQPKVVPEAEIQAPRGKEWQWRVIDIRAAGNVHSGKSPVRQMLFYSTNYW